VTNSDKLTARQKMEAGDWYSCIDPELDAMRDTARRAVWQHNTLPPDERGNIGPALAELIGHVGANALIEAPFHVAYGVNLRLGENVYLNAGCVILDTARVEIGAGTMFGPGVHVYCAEHHRDPELRAQGLEIARPVSIGENVWVGGGAIILAGVTIGDNAIVGAGSVVTRDVPAGGTVVGNPAKPVRAK
jgi:maltose O-acetyltransferase